MSKIRDAQTGDDYADAAGKHLADAVALFCAGRFDGAAYLSGYVVECALKTVIFLETGDPHGHLPHISPAATRLAALPGARTARYFRVPAAGHPMYGGPSAWAPGRRYWPPRPNAEAEATAFLQEAVEMYDSMLVPMALDGLV